VAKRPRQLGDRRPAKAGLSGATGGVAWVGRTAESANRIVPTIALFTAADVERVVAARKKPWLLAQLFGWSIVMKFASGRLSIEEMEAKVTEILGITARAVIVPHPEVAMDVDVGKPENLEMIRSALRA